jgi:molybdopterin molybdotransferase
MDGFAIVAGDSGSLDVVEDIPAGKAPSRRISKGSAARIMTGAPVPEGATAVEPIEKVAVAGGRVTITSATRPGQNIARRGEDVKAGDVVLRRGHVLRAPEVALLSTVGCVTVPVWRKPSCAALSTGDELVAAPAKPGPGQIRESNSRSVAAQLASIGCVCSVLGIARDVEADLEAHLRRGLEHDVLVITGGVSAGDRDLVVPTLKKLGVEYVLHHVAVRPGKPFFFGKLGARRIFALPGNPVSTFVTFELFVRTFVMRMMGHADGRRERVTATLATPLPKKLDRTQFLPAVLKEGKVEILAWHGSGDQVTLTKANALAIQPLDTALQAGEKIDVLKL